jgi:tetratricopeptide (TPR) repeat protein
MKGYSKLFLIVLPALAALFFLRASTVRTAAAEPQQKAASAAQAQDEETPYDDVEFAAYEAATKEPAVEKRGTMLLDFIQKYPKSALMKYIEASYSSLLKELLTTKKYELLQSDAEKWLKLHPDDVVTLGYKSEAAKNLGDYDKCAECDEEIYKKQPQPTLAREIFEVYKQTNNLAKQVDWADKLFKMPEYDADFMLRFHFVSKYAGANNYPKAAEYANLTLKSVDLVKQPNAETQMALSKVRLVSYIVIGTNFMEKDKYDEACDSFRKAVQIKPSGELYYSIAQCQENLKQVDEAMVSYAKVDLVPCDKPETATKAKARLEQLYKAIHNNTTIGIEKITKKAKEEMSSEK